jgi:3-oxoadipate enol-lactonase
VSHLIAGARMKGAEDEAVIFVHGVGSTAAIWDYQLDPIGESRTYRCLAVELRGNGVMKPEPPPELITREGFLEDVLTVADAANGLRFHYVGCSLGGAIGFELWKHQPQRVRSFTFVSSFAHYPNAGAYVQNIVADVRAAGSMERFAHERARKLGMPPGPRTDETIEQMASKSVESYIAATYATWTGDYRSLLPSITVPTLVICGDKDGVTPPAMSREIADAIPEAQMQIIEGAGHVTNADAPERFNELLLDFLGSV